MMRWLTPQEVANLTGQSANQVMKAIKHRSASCRIAPTFFATAFRLAGPRVSALLASLPGVIAASYSPHPHGKGRWWIAEAEAERYRATVKASAA